jgi:hypothetical protein
MRREGGVYVCGKCGASWDPGVQPRLLVAAGLIVKRARGRSLRLAVTARGVTGYLRPARGVAAVGGCR